MSDNNVLEIQNILNQDILAVELSDKYVTFNQLRVSWISEKDEIRNYIYATDTTKTTNAINGWNNKTTIPKLCQIRDNLLANYDVTLFPNDDWLSWEAYDRDSESRSKRDAIIGYMQNKLRESDFRTEISKAKDDFVTYGNAFGEVIFVRESRIDPETGEEVPGYIGPKFKRLSPLDVVFNPLSDSFDKSAKFTRYIKTIGQLKSEINERPDLPYNIDIINKAESVRSTIAAYDSVDVSKASGLRIDGFGSLSEYYQSNYVEILKFQGSYHDMNTGEFMKDREVIIIDRSYIIYNEPFTSWLNKSNMMHVGWRDRPDNLYAMGPLDNLVGMQYRIDHLENQKADAWDFITNPVITIKGNVEEFDWVPGEAIFLGDDGELDTWHPDTTVLNADTQVSLLENRMEDMAGAPRSEAGIRTPGEKTAFEVQTLSNNASKVFQHKTNKFERYIERIVNSMLEIGRHNMEGSDLIRVMDDDIGVADFIKITKEDITAAGKLRPIGARHFSRNARILQDLVSLSASPLWEVVSPDISRTKMRELIEDVLGFSRLGLFKENAAVFEQAETQKMVNAANEQVQLEDVTPTSEEEPLG